jgi:hypothetical protein
MNYIGLDISLNSTGVFIENDNEYMKILSFTNKNTSNKYIKILERVGVEFHFSDKDKYKDRYKDYSDNEIIKLKYYDILSDDIVNAIKNHIDENEKTYCLCEGYSFSKNTSSILDIVSLSTMIKVKMINNIKNISLSIIAPTSLKLDACKLVYEPINIGKIKDIYEYRNNDGLKGGSFKKHDMFKCMLDGNIVSPITHFLNENKNILDLKKIPTPIEDIIDSIFACKVLITQIKSDIEK